MSAHEDTEWNDILRQHGILPPKEVEPVEEPPSPPDLKSLLDDMTVTELAEKIDLAEDETVDDEEAKFLEEYRRKRLATMQDEAAKAKYGHVREISKSDWKTEVNQAGDVYVVIHVAQRSHLLCTLLDDHLVTLARKFPTVKFLRAESVLCIPNYPAANLPSLLIYRQGDMLHQLIGPTAVGGKSVTVKGLEWRLSQLGVLESKLAEEPGKRMQISTVTGSSGNRIGSRDNNKYDSGSESD